jgi:hypothetical protein
LIIAFSPPASAALGKAQNRSDQRHIESTSERQWKLVDAQRGLTGGRSAILIGRRATTPPPTAPTAASRSASIVRANGRSPSLAN